MYTKEGYLYKKYHLLHLIPQKYAARSAELQPAELLFSDNAFSVRPFPQVRAALAAPIQSRRLRHEKTTDMDPLHFRYLYALLRPEAEYALRREQLFLRHKEPG